MVSEFGSERRSTAEQVSALLDIIKQNAQRIRELGQWPSYIDEESLTERVPATSEEENASGFDAGLACSLNLIPEQKQKLSANLHANYSPEAVEQVRIEITNLDPDSETCWWLAACNICTEGGINQDKFLQQISEFKKLANDPDARLAAAKNEFEKMISKCYVDKKIDDQVPYGTEDGSMQGAYIKGYPCAVNYADKYGLYFIGTYHDSLGLENFNWSDEKDNDGRPKSGPVWGSKQFVKCKDLAELQAALEIVKAKFHDELEAIAKKE